MHLQNLLLYQNPYARQGTNFHIDGLRFELFCDNALIFFKYSFIFALPACMKTVKPLAGVDTYILPVALLPLSLLLTPRQLARPKHRRIRNPGLNCAASRLEWLGFWEAGSFPILNRNATPKRFTNWQQSSHTRQYYSDHGGEPLADIKQAALSHRILHTLVRDCTARLPGALSCFPNQTYTHWHQYRKPLRSGRPALALGFDAACIAPLRDFLYILWRWHGKMSWARRPSEPASNLTSNSNKQIYVCGSLSLVSVTLSVFFQNGAPTSWLQHLLQRQCWTESCAVRTVWLWTVAYTHCGKQQDALANSEERTTSW